VLPSSNKQTEEKKRKSKHLTSSWAHGFRGRVGPAPVPVTPAPAPQPQLELPLHNHSSNSHSTTSTLAPAARGLWNSGNGVRGGWGWKVVGRREVGGGR